jgi:hypothetical protein
MIEIDPAAQVGVYEYVELKAAVSNPEAAPPQHKRVASSVRLSDPRTFRGKGARVPGLPGAAI